MANERTIDLQIDVQDSVSVKGAEAWAVGQRNGVDVGPGDPTYHNNAKYYAEVAGDHAAGATRSEEAAEAAKQAADADALKAEGYAVGQQNGQDVGSESPYYHRNTMYYCEESAASKDAAARSKEAAAAEALKAEGYTQGKQDGQDVGSDSPYYHANGAYYKDQAAGSAEAASGSAGNAAADALKSEGYALGKQNGQAVASGSPYYENNADYYRGQAAGSAENAAADALKAEGYAQGKQGGQDVSSDSPYYHANGAYYKDQAAGSAEAASGSAGNAAADALKSEGYALGKQNGQAVASGSPYYQNNADYYRGQAAGSATLASNSAGAAAADALKAEGYADGKQNGTAVSSGSPYYHNNGKYYLEQTEAVAQSIPADYSELSSDVSSLKSAMLLEAETIPDTVQAIAFDSSGNVSSITHSRSGSAVRTDAFTFGTNTITEVRTLSSGESLTIVINIDTLETTVTFAAAA